MPQGEEWSRRAHFGFSIRDKWVQRSFKEQTLHHSTPARWAECPVLEANGGQSVAATKCVQSQDSKPLLQTQTVSGPLCLQVFHISHPLLAPAVMLMFSGLTYILLNWQRLGNACAYVHIPLARQFLCHASEKTSKDDCVSTRMRCWGHRREVLQMAAGKSRDGFFHA